MTNYVAKFVKDFSTKASPLRILLKKDIAWHWDQQQETAFNELKRIISTAPVLSYYEATKPIVLATDASSVGLGAVLLQENRPVAYASRAMTKSQINYAQIEKEMLAIVFGCERFKQYLHGRTFVVETDHKPLVSLFKKSLSDVPIRIQRMMLRVQSFDIQVVYRPSRDLKVADALSRATVEDSGNQDTMNLEQDITVQVHMVIENLPVSDEKREQFRQETERDDALGKLKKYIQEGWPDHKKMVDIVVRPFWNFREQLCIMDGIVFKNTAIVVPRNMQKEMLNLIHQGHMGMERCKGRVRGILYWIGINQDIERIVTNCTTCQKYRRNNIKEPLIPHEVPELPWEKVGVDIFDYKNKPYIVVVDYYSNFIEIQYLPDMKSATVVGILKSIFARHGIPQVIITDNAKQFVCDTVHNFSKEWKFRHITSSPYYPKSNGMAERGVQTIKNLLYKAEESGEDPYLALLNYRNTRRGDMDSPAQLLMSRNLNCHLPLSRKMLKPRVSKDIKGKLEEQKKRSKRLYDRQKRTLRPLNVGEEIMFKKMPDQEWTPGMVTKKTEHPRSYIVEDLEGKTYRRNRFHIYPKSKLDSRTYAEENVKEQESESDKQGAESSEESQEMDKETQFMKNLNKYVTTRGRTVHAPKRFGFE